MYWKCDLFSPDDILAKDIAVIPLNQTAKNIIVAKGGEREVPYNKLIPSRDLKEVIVSGIRICTVNLENIR